MLKQIKIKGYKSIANLQLELTPVNILIGANGAGKSNFLSFFNLLDWAIRKPGRLQLFTAKSGGANLLLLDGVSVTPQMEAELDFETDTGSNHYWFSLFHAAPDTFVFAEEKYRFYRTDAAVADWISLESGHKEAKLVEIASPENIAAQNLVRLMRRCCKVYQFHNTSETSRIRQKGYIEDNRSLREDGSNLAAFLWRLKENEPVYYTRIVDTLNQITPWFGNFVLEPEYDSIILQWEERDSGLIFNASQASDGTLRTMALITLLLQPANNLPDVVILDEPELGLHPYAINIIGGLIQSISHHSQVIVATQSPLLVDCFDPEEIIVVERKNSQSHFDRLNYAELKDWLKEYSLSELWNKNIFGGRPSR